jgi:hypothetical protein
MKKFIIILVSVAFFFQTELFSQTVFIADQTALPCSSVNCPVIASGLPENIGAVTLFIDYDTTLLQYTGNTPGTLYLFMTYDYFINVENGIISISWTYAPGANINGTMLTLQFNYKGGNAALDFTSNCEISIAVPIQTVDVDYVDGYVSPTQKTTYFVDGAVAASGTGLSWESPLKTITEATNKPLTPGDEVLVKPGVYSEALVIKSNGSELVPIKYGVTLSDTNKITFPTGTDLGCVSPASYPGKYIAYVFRSWKCNNGAYPILSVNDAQDYIIVGNAAFIPETGASGDTSLVQASIGLPVFYTKYSSNPEVERVVVNSGSAPSSKANCYIGTPLGTGDSATASSYNIIDGFDLTASATNKIGLRIQSSSFNVYRNSRIYNLDSIGVYVSGSSLKPSRYNIIANNKIYNTKQRAIKIGKHGGTTATSNYAYFTLVKGNEVYVIDDGSSTNDQLWNMVDVHPKTAFTVIEGNTFRSYNSQTAGKGTVEIWDNTRKTNVLCNFFKDIGRVVAGTNALIYVRNNGLNINVFNNVLLNSSLVNDDVYAFRLNAAGHSDSKVVYNTVFNIDNGNYLEDSGPTTPVFKLQDNIIHINYLNGGIYFTNSGTTGRFTVSHNCYPSIPTTVGQPYHGETGRQVGDPLFVNPVFFSSPHGLQLKTGSICLAHGTPVTGITRDYSLRARHASTPGIGAFEAALTSISWTGRSSQDWHNYQNWIPELVPTNTTQAVIPLKANLPVVSASNAVCKGLQLENSANVTINTGRLLTVY